ncbi:MAG: hypothetical protein ACTSW3_03675 [Promethearchaeota archaeon]
MYKIIQIDYHYYWQLEEELNNNIKDFELIQIIDMSSNSDTERIHRATCLIKKIK